MKKFAGIFPSCSRDCLSILAGTIDTVVDQRVCRDRNHCRLALKTTNGLRRHIRAIRLEQNAIERGRRKCLAHVVVALKGGRAAIGDIAAQTHKALHRGSILAKAVQHATGLRHTYLAQHVVRINVRSALPIRVLVPQVQLHRHIAAHGNFELTCHAINLHAMGAGAMSSS